MVIMGTYEEIKDKCLRYKRLWEDPEFPASNDSIRPGLQVEEGIWKRPRVGIKVFSHYCGYCLRMSLSLKYAKMKKYQIFLIALLYIFRFL